MGKTTTCRVNRFHTGTYSKYRSFRRFWRSGPRAGPLDHGYGPFGPSGRSKIWTVLWSGQSYGPRLSKDRPGLDRPKIVGPNGPNFIARASPSNVHVAYTFLLKFS